MPTPTKSYPDTYAIADLPATYSPESGTAALWRTTKGWVERLFTGETNYLSPDLAEAGYFSSPGGNTSFSVLVQKRANPYTVIEFTFKDNRGDQSARTVNLTVPLSRLNNNPDDGWSYSTTTPWEEISRTIVMSDGSQYPLWLGWQNTADGLLLRWRDNHAGQPNIYGKVANIIVRSDRPTLEKMTDAQSGNASVETACAIAPKTLIAGVNAAVSSSVANIFSDAIDYYAPDSGDTALTNNGYEFVLPARRAKLQSIEFQYNRTNDSNHPNDRFFVTADFLRASAAGTIPNPSNGWGFRTNGAVNELVTYLYGGWAFYFQYWFNSDGSIFFGPRTNSHGGTYTNIVARYSSDALHRLTLDEMRDSASTQLGVLDGKTANAWLPSDRLSTAKLTRIEDTKAPTQADLSKLWTKWIQYEWDMANNRANVWLWRRSPVSNDLFGPFALGSLLVDLTPKALGGGQLQVALPQGAMFTYTPSRTATTSQLQFVAGLFSSVDAYYMNSGKTPIAAGAVSSLIGATETVKALTLLANAPANAAFIRYAFTYVKGGVLNQDVAI
jgi:hypothetical protein